MQESRSVEQTTLGSVIKLPSAVISDRVISDQLVTVFQWVTFTCLCQVVTLFGMGSNIVNIICFAKNGFKDPVNISFVGLAVADLGSLLPLLWTNLCLSPAFISAELPFAPVELQHLTSAMVHATFTRISSWITALITLERCMCIIAPIQVRSIVTPWRVAAIIVSVFLVVLVSAAPIYCVNRLGMKFYPARNKTLVGMILMKNRESVETVYYLINNGLIPSGAFIIIITCTSVLVVKLREKTKWRQMSTVSVQAVHVSARSDKVARMVIAISAMFISCFSPICILCVAISLEPEISVVGRYRNFLFVFGALCTFLESVNSSANIFIYYDMSSKYRAALCEMFRCHSKCSVVRH